MSPKTAQQHPEPWGTLAQELPPQKAPTALRPQLCSSVEFCQWRCETCSTLFNVPNPPHNAVKALPSLPLFSFHLIQLISRVWLVDSSALLFTEVSKAWGCRSAYHQGQLHRGPTPFPGDRFQSQVSPTISCQYFSTSSKRSAFFPTREVTFHVTKARTTDRTSGGLTGRLCPGLSPGHQALYCEVFGKRHLIKNFQAKGIILLNPTWVLEGNTVSASVLTQCTV